MDVTIRERKISLGIQYDIDTPKGRWYAQQKMFALLTAIDLLESEDGPAIANLKGELSLLRNRCEFDLTDGRTAQFGCTKLLEQVYECTCGTDVLTLYRHHGLHHSIFQGDQQIAAYSKNPVSFGKGNEYQLRMNRDADMVLIICMVLALSVDDDNSKREIVNIDYGSIGPQARPFDETWEPR